jgi:hypothetical protein
VSSTVSANAWAEIVHHASDGILEERWLPGQMTDGRRAQTERVEALQGRAVALCGNPIPFAER